MKLIRLLSDLPNFFKRRKQVLTIIGAVIVFSTFAIKEIWRDDIKQEKDALENAITVFDIKISQMPSSVQLVQENNAQINKILLSNDSTYLRGQLGSVYSARVLCWRVDDAIAMLIEAYPSESEKLKLEKKISDKLLADQRAQKKIERYGDEAQKTYSNGNPPTHEIRDTHKALIEYENSLSDLQNSTFDYGYAVRDSASITAKSLTQTYKIVNIASIVFYAIGWGLSLAGRLFSGGGLVDDGD